MVKSSIKKPKNEFENKYTADITIKLTVKVKGPDKNKKNDAKKILKDPKTYNDIVYPHNFNNKNLDIIVNNNCTTVNLKIKNMKLNYYYVDIPNNSDEIMKELNINLQSSISDGWGESGIEFGEAIWQYSESFAPYKRTILTQEQIKQLKPYYESYYLYGGSITLPPEVNPVLEYDIPKEWCKKEKVFNPDRPEYFYKHIKLYYDKSKDKYGVTNIHSVVDKYKKGLVKSKLGRYEVPKKLESEIIKRSEYWCCAAPRKISYRSYPPDKLPKGIPIKFFRKDKQPKRNPYYFLGDRKVYKEKPNLIWWDKGNVIKVENIKKNK